MAKKQVHSSTIICSASRGNVWGRQQDDEELRHAGASNHFLSRIDSCSFEA
jgi:hypothetical protein